MANLLAGFVKGFADNQVDQIQERRKLENEEKKAKMLADLQRETSQANFLFEENFKKSNRVDAAMSTIDPDTGKVTQRAQDGSVLSARDMTPAELASHKRKEQGDQLSIDNIRSQIDSRGKGDARDDRVANARIGSYNRANQKALDGSDDPTDSDIANELVFRYSKDVEAATESGNISQTAIRAAAIELVKNSRTGEDAQESFLRFLGNYSTGRKSTDRAKR